MNELLMLPWHTEGQAPLAVSKMRLGMKPDEIFMTTPNPVVVILCQPTLLGQLWRCHWSTIHSNRLHNNNNNKTVCYLNGWEISNPESRLLIYTNSELVNPILDSTRFDINDTSYQCTQLLLESSQFWENNIQQHDVFISSFSDRCRWQRGQNRLLFLWIHSFDLLASR